MRRRSVAGRSCNNTARGSYGRELYETATGPHTVRAMQSHYDMTSSAGIVHYGNSCAHAKRTRFEVADRRARQRKTRMSLMRALDVVTLWRAQGTTRTHTPSRTRTRMSGRHCTGLDDVTRNCLRTRIGANYAPARLITDRYDGDTRSGELTTRTDDDAMTCISRVLSIVDVGAS